MEESVMATSIVTIDAPDKVVTCDAMGSTQHVFNIKNTSGRELTIGARVITEAPLEQGWSMEVVAPAEQALGNNVLTQIPVRIQVPTDGTPGRYTYRLLVYSTRNSGEEFTESEAVAFEVPVRKTEVQPPPPNRWRVWVAVIAGVFVLGGLAAWLFWPKPPELVNVPNLVGQRFDMALPRIQQAGFTFDVAHLQRKRAGESNVGKVVDQNPPGNIQMEKGTEITLTLGESERGVVLTGNISKELLRANPLVFKAINKRIPRSVEPPTE
jgi:hypothetical protein